MSCDEVWATWVSYEGEVWAISDGVEAMSCIILSCMLFYV